MTDNQPAGQTPDPRLEALGGYAERMTNRMHIDYSPAMVERMNWLIDICGLETHKELFNSAMSLFDWAVQQVIEGRVVASIDEPNKTYATVTLPALSNASERGGRLDSTQTEGN